MSYSIQSVILQGDVSYSLHASINPDDKTVMIFDLMLFGGRFAHADVDFLYRVRRGDSWLSDAVILADNSSFASGGTMMGMPCSPSGTTNKFLWRYGDNGIAWGGQCEVKVLVRPSPTLFMYYRGVTTIEYFAGQDNKVQEGIIRGKVIDRDSQGRFLCLTDTSFYIMKPDGTKLWEQTGLSSPSHAQEMANGHYLCMDSGNNILIETYETGGIYRSFNGTGLWNNPKYFVYDELTTNLLVSGGSINKVYEMTWGGLDYGTVLWSHGETAPGDDMLHLNTPLGVSYDDQNRDIVVTADYGNNRIVVADRTPPMETISVIDNVAFGSADVAVHAPFRIGAYGGVLWSTELSGEEEFFSTDRTLHPTFVRSRPHTVEDSKDKLNQYRNLLFAPVIRPT